MKIILRIILLNIIFLITMFINICLASTSYVINDVHPVQFYVIDFNKDNEVSLSVTSISIGNYELQYSLDNSIWKFVDSDTVNIKFDKNYNDDKLIVYWRLYKKDSEPITYADLKFQGIYEDHENTLWNSVIFYWNKGGNGITFGTPNNEDKVAPAPVPILSSSWLLGLGLAGFLIYRRRIEEY